MNFFAIKDLIQNTNKSIEDLNVNKNDLLDLNQYKAKLETYINGIFSKFEVEKIQLEKKIETLKTEKNSIEEELIKIKDLGLKAVDFINIIKSENENLKTDKEKMISEIFHQTLENKSLKERLDSFNFFLKNLKKNTDELNIET